jgi:glutamine---fructose-6-phosphate transaminase (isomerizing)
VSLRDEILEQPAAARRLLASAGGDAWAGLRAAVTARRPGFVVIVARGTSDNAGLYLQYLLAVRNGLVGALAAPSTITLYGGRPQMAEALVVGISQSGRSPDIVAVLEAAREQGATTVALTNDVSSALAAAAEHSIDLAAGPELATAATKSYTAQLLAGVLVSGALDPLSAAEAADLERVPALMEEALATEDAVRGLAAGHADRQRGVVLGRGYSYATAREWALKSIELAQVPLLAFSAADFEHGPLALAEPGLPVLAVVSGGPERESMAALLARLRSELRARLMVISDSAELRALDEGLPLPARTPGWLAPAVEIVPAQLYTYHLTIARGLDPERPRTITKVTETH